MGGVNMITILLFIEKALAIAATFPKYKLGCSGDNGFCDCIGLIIGALKRAGVKWKGIHGSNYAARYRLKGKIKRITSVKDLKVGDLVFKGKADQSDLPARYKKGGSLYNGDLTDYYHVGIVISVNPLTILHMTSPTVKRDTSLGKWGFYGECTYVKDATPSPEPVPTPVPVVTSAVVTAVKGSTVNMRAGAGLKYRIIERVPIGATVDILREDGEWDYIRHDAKTGYMMDMYLMTGKEVG
jgi:hypothetical protein